MHDIDRLKTRLRKDKSYSSDTGYPSGMRGFVCPRANAYGGRDGIIPPAVAAVNGLIPKGMRRVSVSDVAKTASEAVESGKSESDMYSDYYSSGAGSTVPPQCPAVSAPAPQDKPIPATAVTPAPATLPESLPESRILQEVKAVREQLASRGDGRMFSRDAAEDAAGDTLDDFYADLRGVGFGTEVQDRHGNPVMVSGDPGSRGKSVAAVSDPALFPAPQSPAGDSVAAMAMQAMVDTNKGLRDRVSSLESDVTASAGVISELRATIEGLRRQLENMDKVPGPVLPAIMCNTVRVVLSAEEEHIKIGGDGWECRIVGAIHRGRDGEDMVVTVSDTGYASELMAEIRPGRVVVVSGSGRTSCTYFGSCDKLYGEYGSSDYISAFRFSRDAG